VAQISRKKEYKIIMNKIKKKILLVLDTFYPNVDGPVNSIINIGEIINANPEFNCEVEILVPYYPEPYECKNVIVHRCKSIRFGKTYRTPVPIFDGNVKKIINKGNFDLIHIHSPFTLGKAVAKLAKKNNIPTIMTVHTQYKSDFERTLKSKFLQNFMMKYIMKVINMCDVVTTVSNGAKTLIRDEYRYSKSDIKVIRNGTDLKVQDINKQILKNTKDKYNIKNEFVFLYVGRIVENKNIQFSLEVLKLLKEQGHNNFKFLIVGSGDYTNTLKSIINNYNLQDNVVFTGRINNREEISAIYKCADLFMFPSTFDTCGIVVIEAAANALPSALVENTCASEVIINRKNGLALPQDVNVWTNEISKIIDRKDLIVQMKEKAQKTIYVSWETIVKQYVDLYNKVIKNKNSQ